MSMRLWGPKRAALQRRENLGTGAEDTRRSGKVGTAVKDGGGAIAHTAQYDSHVWEWLWSFSYGQKDLGSWTGSMREPTWQEGLGRQDCVKGPVLGGLLRLSGLNGL